MTSHPYPCAACGLLTMKESPGSYEVCPACGWEDDALQLANPTTGGGANSESLVEAQASALTDPPTTNFRRDPAWRVVSDEEAYWYRSECNATHHWPNKPGAPPYWIAPFERVLTIPGYYDGARSGLALFRGLCHYFSSQFIDFEGEEDIFDLWPVDDETVQLALEDWAIWRRWHEAFHAGRVTSETHPALPQDRSRWDRLQQLLSGKLPPQGQPSISLHGEFRGHLITATNARVRWRTSRIQ